MLVGGERQDGEICYNPGIIASIFEEIGKDSDSKIHSKASQ